MVMCYRTFDKSNYLLTGINITNERVGTTLKKENEERGALPRLA
jgi:hypothetical protein